MCKSIAEQATIEVQKNETYHRSRLIRSTRKFLFYRAALSTYFLIWFITQNTAVELPKHYIYLTTWGETLLNIYFTSAFGLSIYFYIFREEVERPQKGMVKITMWICELFRIFSWDVGIMLSLAYWILLRTDLNAYSWHCHLINSVSIIVDLVVTDTQVKLYQFIWTIGIGCCFLIHSLMLYFVSDRVDYQIIYEETLDWGNYPQRSLLLAIVVLLFAIPLVHLMVYYIQRKRDKMLDRSGFKHLIPPQITISNHTHDADGVSFSEISFSMPQ
ncbi:Oidioi.mRNA.OKI2018_I69.chr2.g4168.t1.cds [Oikopleura dioica]|uniref:Oidioi.mRNA.OKI2018_I69.chr2.g4168.t1.cds n=1 Tax=Oikopleura dioica TaxID=34765 RepID=A0ABN7T0P7_OIKDI|nr:Oidioi.mRNA.OKI2018_I69.chr2.g4168.t1.cds [Oikopleura dioica]